jgi:hypothetical protein
MEEKINRKYEAAKKLTKADGTIAYIWEGKLHNWEGPAYIPQGDLRKREYHLNGIPFTEEQWKEARREREGLPFYKQASIKGNTNRF